MATGANALLAGVQQGLAIRDFFNRLAVEAYNRAFAEAEAEFRRSLDLMESFARSQSVNMPYLIEQMRIQHQKDMAAEERAQRQLEEQKKAEQEKRESLQRIAGEYERQGYPPAIAHQMARIRVGEKPEEIPIEVRRQISKDLGLPSTAMNIPMVPFMQMPFVPPAAAMALQQGMAERLPASFTAPPTTEQLLNYAQASVPPSIRALMGYRQARTDLAEVQRDLAKARIATESSSQERHAAYAHLAKVRAKVALETLDVRKEELAHRKEVDFARLAASKNEALERAATRGDRLALAGRRARITGLIQYRNSLRAAYTASVKKIDKLNEEIAATKAYLNIPLDEFSINDPVEVQRRKVLQEMLPHRERELAEERAKSKDLMEATNIIDNSLMGELNLTQPSGVSRPHIPPFRQPGVGIRPAVPVMIRPIERPTKTPAPGKAPSRVHDYVTLPGGAKAYRVGVNDPRFKKELARIKSMYGADVARKVEEGARRGKAYLMERKSAR